MSLSRVPLATYRVQLNSAFPLQRAAAIVPYLARLGVSELYASPILQARAGSTHGYDVVDSNRLSPELGSEESLEELHQALASNGLGLLLDIVPNHMAASSDNPWWYDVLKFGADSQYARYFDVNWDPFTAAGSLRNRVLLPILGKPYGEILEAGELVLRFDDGAFTISYWDHRLPVAPRSYPLILRTLLERSSAEEGSWVSTLRDAADEARFDNASGEEMREAGAELEATLRTLYEREPEFRNAVERTVALFNGDQSDPASFDRLDSLLETQWYRLSYWRMAGQEINYRRFFDVTDLIGLRVEDAEVFAARHERICEWVRRGIVTGLRIDHIDGLYDPVSYLRKLQSTMAECGGDPERRPYVVVEKILGHGEHLPESFVADGTTGYDSLTILNGVFVDSRNLQRLSEIYESFLGERADFFELSYRAKKHVLNGLFAGEVRGLAAVLATLAAHDRNARDFAPSDLQEALAEVTAEMSVYRTYIRDSHVAPLDSEVISRAVARSLARNGDRLDGRIFQFVERVLLLRLPRYAEEHRSEWLDFVMRWQQFTGRAMAKGIEDTAFYQYNRLLSLNEVGGEPDHREAVDPLDLFHSNNEYAAAHWPLTLNATSTHDTKRSEDVRARINVLSELPDVWERQLRIWGRLNHRLKSEVGGRLAPDRNEETMLYQTLLGVWPLVAEEESSLRERLPLFVEKALREAKVNTSWLAPDMAYEEAVKNFTLALIDPANEEFLGGFRTFQKTIAFYGFLNSLAAVVLKVFSPGVPDFYQGSESWDFSLVDPDNRRPVDFERRAALAERFQAPSVDVESLLTRWDDGGVKFFVTMRSLAVRKRWRDVLERGSYVRLSATGEANDHVCAFARGDDEGASLVVVVPRLCATLADAGQLPIESVWKDRALELPARSSRRWKNAFTGDNVAAIEIGAGESALPLSEVFGRFPVAVLERVDGD